MSETMLAAWLQVLAVIVSAALAGVIAIWGIQSQRAISRKVATLTYMSTIDADEDMIKARAIFIREAKKPEGLTPWATSQDEHCEQCNAIRLVLNEIELASIAIQLGTIDYEFYKLYNRATVIRYWYAAAPFVIAIRDKTGLKSLYHEFEELARNFESNRPPHRRFMFLKLR